MNTKGKTVWVLIYNHHAFAHYNGVFSSRTAARNSMANNYERMKGEWKNLTPDEVADNFEHYVFNHIDIDEPIVISIYEDTIQ